VGNILIDRGLDRETETKRGKAKGLTIRSSKMGSEKRERETSNLSPLRSRTA